MTRLPTIPILLTILGSLPATSQTLTCLGRTLTQDTCLIGSWRETTLAIPGYAKIMLEAQLAEHSGELSSFDVPPPEVVFVGDSINSATVNFTGSGSTNMRGEETHLEITRGYGYAHWFTAGDKLMICPESVSITGNITISRGGRNMMIPFGREMPSNAGETGVLFDYTCDANTVTLISAERDIEARLER